MTLDIRVSMIGITIHMLERRHESALLLRGLSLILFKLHAHAGEPRISHIDILKSCAALILPLFAFRLALVWKESQAP